MGSEDSEAELDTKRDQWDMLVENNRKHVASIFADRAAGGEVNGIETKDEAVIPRQSIFRSNPGIISTYGLSPSGHSPFANATGAPTHYVHRSQTFDSSFIASHHPRESSKSFSFSYKSSPKRSPTFPFRPNAALCSSQSCQMTSRYDTTPDTITESRIRNDQIDSDDQFIKRNANLFAHNSISLHVDFVGHEVSRLFLSPSSSRVIESEILSPQYFPVSAFPPGENTYWWLNDAADLEHELTATSHDAEVIMGEYEIELVDSEESDCTTKALVLDKSSNMTIPRETSLDDLNNVRREYSRSDVMILNDIIQKLKDDMERADHLDGEEKLELEKLLERLKSTMSQDDIKTPALASSENVNQSDRNGNVMNFNIVSTNDASGQQSFDSEKDSTSSTYDSLRKPLVAITGGALVTTGVVLIPMPVVPGILVIYAGLSVLATEFEGARDALEAVKEPLKRFLADEEEEGYQTTLGGLDERVTLWTDTIPSSFISHLWYGNDIDDSFMALIRMKKDTHVHFRKQAISDEEKEAAKKARLRNNDMKRWVRKMLNLETGDCGTVPSMGSSHAPVDSTQVEPKHRNQTVFVRFDSILSSYGEEVDEDGVTSDRLNKFDDETGKRIEKTIDSLCSSVSNSSSTLDLNSRHDSDPSMFAVGYCHAFLNDACAD